MNKSIYLLIVFILIPQLSFASSHNLKTIIDDYIYSITVEWDQRDVTFAEKVNQDFKDALKDISLEDISKDDLKSIFPFLASIDIENEFNHLNLSNSSEFGNFIKRSQSRLYQNGSSWNGQIIIPTLFVAFVTTIITINVYRESKYWDCIDSYNDPKLCEKKY